MDYDITKEYYSMWLGTEVRLLDETGVFWVYNAARNERLAGYPDILDIYTFITPHNIIVSYGERAEKVISQIKGDLAVGMTTEEIRVLLGKYVSSAVKHSIKYIYSHDKSAKDNPAVKLSVNDFDRYLNFFKDANPQCEDTSWVKEYFLEISEKGYCHGIMENGHILSVTDAPDMLFMSGKAQDIGINTLSPYRGKGYAKYACLSCVKAMMRAGICPQWSTDINNIASQRLAESVGFEKFFDSLAMTITWTV